MQYYNDHSNEAAANLLFMLFQMVMLLIVYGVVYTALVGVKLSMQKFGLSWVVFFPEVVALFLYPVVLYRTRRMFKAKKRLRAVAWCMAWASVIIVVLYVHLDRLASL
ncbi:MAG: hypothetical protein L3J47_02835 [Sulfurovum sp.]|nr:hypothetical protein [Sulfurovum sp.]